MVQISGSSKTQKLNSQRSDKTEDYPCSTENNEHWHIILILWEHKQHTNCTHKILTNQNNAFNVGHKHAYVKVPFNLNNFLLIEPNHLIHVVHLT